MYIMAIVMPFILASCCDEPEAPAPYLEPYTQWGASQEQVLEYVQVADEVTPDYIICKRKKMEYEYDFNDGKLVSVHISIDKSATTKQTLMDHMNKQYDFIQHVDVFDSEIYQAKDKKFYVELVEYEYSDIIRLTFVETIKL